MCVALAHACFVRRYAHFESTIPNSPPIQPHESALVDKSLTFDDQNVDYEDPKIRRVQMAAIELLGTGWKRVPNTIASPVAYFQKIDDDSSAWGKTVATVDASLTRVFSYIWNQHSYEHMNRHVKKEGTDALNKVVFPPDSHSMLRAFIVNFGLAISARVFSTWLVWRQEPDKSFTIAFTPMSDYKLLNTSTTEIDNALNYNAAAADAIRGAVKGFWRIKPLAPEGKRATERTAKLTVCAHTQRVRADLGLSCSQTARSLLIKGAFPPSQTAPPVVHTAAPFV